VCSVDVQLEGARSCRSLKAQWVDVMCVVGERTHILLATWQQSKQAAECGALFLRQKLCLVSALGSFTAKPPSGARAPARPQIAPASSNRLVNRRHVILGCGPHAVAQWRRQHSTCHSTRLPSPTPIGQQPSDANTPSSGRLCKFHSIYPATDWPFRV
jgi:hypothetical protein